MPIMPATKIASIEERMAKNLRRWLERKEMTQMEVAKKAKCSRATVTRMVNGRGFGIAVGTLNNVALALKIDIAELLR